MSSASSSFFLFVSRDAAAASWRPVNTSFRWDHMQTPYKYVNLVLSTVTDCASLYKNTI